MCVSPTACISHCRLRFAGAFDQCIGALQEIHLQRHVMRIKTNPPKTYCSCSSRVVSHKLLLENCQIALRKCALGKMNIHAALQLKYINSLLFVNRTVDNSIHLEPFLSQDIKKYVFYFSHGSVLDVDYMSACVYFVLDHI